MAVRMPAVEAGSKRHPRSLGCPGGRQWAGIRGPSKASLPVHKEGGTGYEDPIGRKAQRGVIMEPWPGATFKMPQAHLLLEFQVVSPHDPTVRGPPHELLELGLRRQVPQLVLGGFGSAARPLGQQPQFPMGLRPPVVPMRRPDPHRHQARWQLLLGSLPPAHPSQGLLTGVNVQLTHRKAAGIRAAP